MVVTSDQKIAEKARILRDQGKASFDVNFHTELGHNWRLSEIHALVGSSQLKRLQEFIQARRAVAKVYDDLLSNCESLKPLREAPGVYSSYYKYIVFTNSGGQKREVIKKTMREKYQIGLSGEVYSVPLHRQPVLQNPVISLPQAERLCDQHLCLPISAVMSHEEAEYVVSSLKEVAL